MRECVITAAARTAVGAYLGSLKTVEAQDMGAAAIRAAAQRSGIALGQADQVIMSEVYGYTPNIARCAALVAGVPERVPAYSVDRQCASSLQAVVSASYEIQAGEADVVIAGGVEMMSRMVYYLPPSSRYNGFRMGNVTLYDTFSRGVTIVQPAQLYPGLNMGLTAENVAKELKISRREQDAFALESQRKAKAAMEAGKFQDEIIPVEIAGKSGTIIFETDEHPRPGATLESLAKLKPAFLSDGTGTVTAGNSSGMNDGASAVVVMSREKAEQLGCAPLARIVSSTSVGLDPRVMGLGPAYAIPRVLQKAGLALSDIGLIELNEAFAAQAIGCLKLLCIEPGSALYDRVNVNGGAIALGHALANSGTRLLTTLLYEMKRRNVQYGLVSLCIGGGQGMAMIVENMAN